jgi:ATP-dependent DNA helicase RecG
MNILDKLRQPENRKLELKRSLPPSAKWLKTITSFANGAGGELILGIDDKSRDILGIENTFELEEKISNTIHDSIRPSISIKRLKELIGSGSVEKIGSGKNTKYTVKE